MKMGRKVCFIDDEGQAGTCIKDDENCAGCEFSDEKHKKFVEECRNTVSDYEMSVKSEHPVCDGSEGHLLEGIRTHELGISIDFVDQDILITGTVSKQGIQVFAVTRCFEEDRGCTHCNCLCCPYTDKTKQQEIFDKYEMKVVEILRDAYKKIEAMR
jgi:hypothetical protein